MADLRPITLSAGQPAQLPNTDALIIGQGAVMVEQASALATPASGFGVLYALTNGKVYFRNDAGVVYDLGLSVTVGTTAEPTGGVDGDYYLQEVTPGGGGGTDGFIASMLLMG